MVESASRAICFYLYYSICIAGRFHWITRVARVDSTILRVDSTG